MVTHLLCSPDKQLEGKFKAISEAYSVLVDLDQRIAYDYQRLTTPMVGRCPPPAPMVSLAPPPRPHVADGNDLSPLVDLTVPFPPVVVDDSSDNSERDDVPDWQFRFLDSNDINEAKGQTEQCVLCFCGMAGNCVKLACCSRESWKVMHSKCIAMVDKKTCIYCKQDLKLEAIFIQPSKVSKAEQRAIARAKLPVLPLSYV